MNRIVHDLDEEFAALRGSALVELNQLGEDLGLDLAPRDQGWSPGPPWLIDARRPRGGIGA